MNDAKMNEDFHRDDAAKAKYTAASRAIKEVLDDKHACSRLGVREHALLHDTRGVLLERAAHIVAVWD